MNKPRLKLAYVLASLMILSATACQKNPETSKATNPQANIAANADTSSGLVGCYTTLKTEPAQIKINLDNGNYSMQMREFNDPDKLWDKPEPLQSLANNDIKTYFNVEEKSVEKALIRPDKVFAVAQVQDNLINLDAHFDSNYLGYIAKSETAKGNSTTIYKVKCESKL